MPMVVNKQPRLLHIGGAHLIPGIPALVEDEWMKHPDVESMLEEGDLELAPDAEEETKRPEHEVKPPAGQEKPNGDKVTKPAERQPQVIGESPPHGTPGPIAAHPQSEQHRAPKPPVKS